MNIADLKPVEDMKPIEMEEMMSSLNERPKITRSPPLPTRCIHCKSLLSIAGSRGIATWPVCIKCFEKVYHDNLTSYLKKWIEHEHSKQIHLQF